MTKDKILASLPNLNQADLKAIVAVASGLLEQAPRVTPKAANGAQAWLYEALGAVVSTEGGHGAIFNKGFGKNAPIVIDFMKANFPKAMENKTTALALMRYLLGLLVNDLKTIQVPVTKNTMAMNLGRLPAVFENAFPDYTKAGIAMLVMQKILGKE